MHTTPPAGISYTLQYFIDLKNEEIKQAARQATKQGIKQGLKEGEQQKAIQIALNMLRKGFEVQQIAELLELDVKFVEKLKAELAKATAQLD